MNSLTDQQLLRDYAAHKSDAAFAELVRRHVDLVYSAALRMVCDAHLAEDVTQGAFVALAKNARQLADRPVLSGWLHRTAQNLAANAVRSDVRRRAREQEAAAMNQLLANESDANWEIIAPHLDAALGELNDVDRDALLLRYFERKSAREMAQILGTSEDAAQKRVSRAVERLREFFSKQKITVGASGLVVLISANAVQSAPIGLAATISAAAVLTGTAVHTSTVIAATKIIAMTTLQKTLVTATLVAAVGTGIFEAHQVSQLREQNQVLQQQQTPLAEQIRQLQADNESLSNRLAAIGDSRKLSDEQFNELLKLRGEVALLQNAANDPFMKLALALKAKKEKLLQLFAERPEFYVPEIQLLDDKDWLDIIRKADQESTNWFGQTITGESDEEIKQSGIGSALGDVIRAAREKFAPMMQQALKSYMDSYAGQKPSAISDLKPYFESAVDDSILNQYKLLSPGMENPLFGDKDLTDTYVVVGKDEVDFANPLVIGPYSSNDILAAKVAQVNGILKPITDAFAAAHNNAEPSSVSEIEPYLTTPDQQKAFDDYNKLLKSIQINFPWFHYPFAPY